MSNQSLANIIEQNIMTIGKSFGLDQKHQTILKDQVLTVLMVEVTNELVAEYQQKFGLEQWQQIYDQHTAEEIFEQLVKDLGQPTVEKIVTHQTQDMLRELIREMDKAEKKRIDI